MDTTTNVVGILVIVLVITQLGVSGAVNRIRASLPEVSAEELDKQRQEVLALRDMAAKISEGAPAIASQIAIDQSLVLSAQEAIEKMTADLAALQQAIIAAEAEKEKLDDLTAAAKALAAQLAEAKNEQEKLKKQLAAVVPADKRPAPREIHLPNPRAAPQGASPMVVLCKENRAMVVPIDGLRNLAEARIRQLRLPADKTGAVDGQKLVEYFDRVDVGTRQFRLRVRLHNFYPYLVFEPRPMAGDSVEVLRSGQSATGVALHRADAEKYFARFLVWSDSFEAYGEARSIADAADLPAGWEPMLPNQVFQISLASAVKVQRPPPPPPPKDPPPPAKPPAGGEPIAPPKPPLPRDDID